MVSPWMNAKKFLLRRDFAPNEAWGEDTPGVSPWELHLSLLAAKPYNPDTSFASVCNIYKVTS